jgi:APA family basic amino acid/polyamine antiporter
VIEVMAEDIPPLRPLAERTATGAPSRAVLLQGALALAFLLTDSFERILTYAGFTLTLFALLAVIGVIRDRPMEAVGGAVTLGVAALLSWVVGERES